MAEEKTFPMTLEGKKKLEDELEEYRLKRRPEVIKRIKIARSYGDLSENSEYESAKDEQAMVESRIAQIENMLQYAEIIDNEDVDKDEKELIETLLDGIADVEICIEELAYMFDGFERIEEIKQNKIKKGAERAERFNLKKRSGNGI